MALKILLADDNITAQRLGAKILADAGHQVIAVSNGAAAVKRIASERPDLLILDVYMPGYSGLEVCAKVKGAPDTARVPVLLSVTSMEPFSPEEGNQARADGVMVKPFIASDLLAVVENFERKLHASVPAAPPPKVQAPAIEQGASYEEWKVEAAPEEELQPVPVQVPHEMTAAPALGFDELPVAPVPTDEAFAAAAAESAAAEFGVEPAAFPTPAPVSKEPEETQRAFEATPEPVPPAAVSGYELAMEPQLEVTPPEPAPAAVPAEAAHEVSPPPELEYTAAQVGEVEVATAPELELTIEPNAAETVIAQDPALVTTPEEMAKFKTAFGVDKPEEVPVGIAVPEPAAEARLEPVSEEVQALPEPVGEAGVDTAPLDAVTESAPELQPAAAGLDTVRLEAVPEVPAEPQPPEAIAIAEAVPAPEPQPARAQESVPEPVSERAPQEEEIEIEMPEELRPAFTAGPSAAAVAPAREPAPQMVTEPATVEAATPHGELVTQFAAELEHVAQTQPGPEAQPQAEFEAEPPAAAALPAAAAPVDDERLVAGVSAVLDRYLAGLKQEMVAAIVRELKK